MAELAPAGAAEYAACFLARWVSYADGSSDEPPGDLAPEYLRVLLAERDQLRDRLTAVRTATEEWHAFALEHRDDPDPAAQAAWRAMAHALCCVLTAHDDEPGKKPCPDCAPPVQGHLELEPMPCHQPQGTWASNHGCDPCATCGRCRICDAVARGAAEQAPDSGTIET